MARKMGTASTTKAERLSAIETAEKSGEAWARRFIDRATANPEGYALKGWIGDAENLFKGNLDELDAFYETLQTLCMGQQPPDQDHLSLEERIAQVRACIVAIEAALVDRATDEDCLTDETLMGLASAAVSLLDEARESMNRPAEAVHHG